MITNTAVFGAIPTGTELSSKPKWSAEAKTGKSFDSFMNQTEKSAAPERIRDDNPINKRTDKPPVKSKDAQGQTRSENDTKSDTIENQEPNETEPVKNQAKESEAVESPKGEQIKDPSQNEEKTLKDLSSVLNIPEESILQILNSLNLNLSDLTDKDNLDLFMQKVFDVASPVQLLQIPDIKTVFESVQQLMAPYETESKPQVQTQNENSFESTKELAETVPSLPDVQVDPQTDSSFQDTDSESFHMPQQHTEITAEIKPDNTSTKPSDLIAEHELTLSNEEDETAIFNNMASPIQDTNEHIRLNNLTVKAEATRNINTQDVINQIVENVKVDVRNNVSEVRVSLRPEHLGDVTLKVMTENGIITAQFVAENQRVKEIIESNFNQLRDSLQQQGLQISELSVSVGQDTNQERMESFLRNQQDARTRVRQVSGTAEAEAAATAEEIANTDPWQETGSSMNYTA